MSEYKLINNILDLSSSNNWDTAKLEWALAEVYESDEPDTCLCGHFPIIEVCILNNILTKNQATVGNCCVKKFIGLPSDSIFQSVKRIRKDNSKSLNEVALKHAYNKGWINKWELDFGLNTKGKRKLSDKQLKTRIKINEKMLSSMKRKATTTLS